MKFADEGWAMLARFGGTTSAAVLLAFSASGEWMTLAPPGDPPTLFSVTGTVASAAVRNNAPVPAEGARTSPQQVLPTRLPPPDGYCAALREAWTNANASAAEYVGATEIADMGEDAPEFPGTVLRFGWLKQSLGQRSYWGVPME